MIEITPDRYDSVTGLFPDVGLWASLPKGVIESRQSGRIFVDNMHSPRSALVCHSNGYACVGGEDRGFADQLATGIFRLTELDVIHLAGANSYWQSRIGTLFPDLSEPYKILCYDHQPNDRRPPLSLSLPEACRIERIDKDLAELVANDDDSGLHWYFDSTEHYLEQGLGFAVLRDTDLAGYCFTCFVGGGTSDAQLRVFEPFRRKGLATSLSCRLRDGMP